MHGRFTWLLCLSLCIVADLSARQLYVAQTGGRDGSGRGAISAPFATLTGALTVAQQRDTITFRQGTYEGHGRIAVPYLTLRGYPGEKAKIARPYVAGSEDATLRFWSTAHHSTLKNLEISGGYYTVMYYSDWTYGPDRAHHGLIEDCNLWGSGYDVIKITPECDGMVIRRCEIHHSGKYYEQRDPGNLNKNCQGIDNVNADSMLVQDSWFHDIPSQAIFFKGGAMDCMVERVKVENCEYGIFLGASTDLEFHSTDVNPNYYQAIRGTVRNCLIRNIQDCGICFECSRDCKVYNNTLIKCGAKVDGVAIRFGLEGTGMPDGTLYVPANVEATFLNNIVLRYSKQADEWSNWIIYFRGDGSYPALAPEGLHFDNNVYWDPNWPTRGPAVANNNIEGQSATYYTLAQWAATPFHCTCGSHGEKQSAYADPRIDTLTGTLLQGSICRAAGAAVKELRDDFYGRSRSGVPDIGAVQTYATAVRSTAANPVGAAPGIVMIAADRRSVSVNVGTGQAVVRLSDCAGRSLLTRRLIGSAATTIPLPRLMDGIYFITVQGPGISSSTRLVVDSTAR